MPWEHPMAVYFEDIGGVRSYIPLSLSPQQQICQSFLIANHQKVQQHKARDLHLKALINSVQGNCEEDVDEPITDHAFSQFRFYRIYAMELIYFPEKFDFLTMCIERGVCSVKKIPVFMSIIEKLISPPPARIIPCAVIYHEKDLEEDEERRIDAFVLKKDWKCTVKHYLT